MKYYLIAGEASGDLHASHLMRALKERDTEAHFRYYGGDMMQSQGGTLVQHYRDLAYMGFIPVLMHLHTIMQGMKRCKQDIVEWQPDVLILVDYPGFNLKIAKALSHSPLLPRHFQTIYYISPKIWAWKEHRIKDIKRYIDRVYSILPFEVDFFEGKHNYPIDYVGNPTVDEVRAFQTSHPADADAFRQKNNLDNRPVIALLPGSRRQELKDNLTRMLEAAQPFASEYQIVVAGAPGIEEEYYHQWTGNTKDKTTKNDGFTVLYEQTYTLLQHATAALVTSGTATLETALFNVPQVVCYYMKCGRIVNMIRPYFLKCPFISLVNLVANSEIVPELVAADMNVPNVRTHLKSILPGGERRQRMLDGYQLMAQRLGAPGAPDHAAELILKRITNA